MEQEMTIIINYIIFRLFDDYTNENYSKLFGLEVHKATICIIASDLQARICKCIIISHYYVIKKLHIFL